jgi:hypothetical protein
LRRIEMNMGLIDIHQPAALVQSIVEQSLKRFEKGRAFLRIGFVQ